MEFAVLLVLILALAGTWSVAVEFSVATFELSLPKLLIPLLVILIGSSYFRLPGFFSLRNHKEAKVLLLWLLGWLVWMAFSSNWSTNSVMKSSTLEGFLVLA